MSAHFPINSWAPDDRPREKLVKYGQKSLTNSELLAILLGSGTPNESAVMLARRMLAQYDNHLDRLAQCSVEELCEFHAVGLAKATRLAAAFELVRRHKQSRSSAFSSAAVNRFLIFFNLILGIYNMKNFGSFISINNMRYLPMSNSAVGALPKLQSTWDLPSSAHLRYTPWP